MFRIVGIVNGEQERIEYAIKDGKGTISGDPMIMFLMRNSLERMTPIGPVGQYMDRSIDNPLAVLFMIRECFDTILSWEGNIPEADGIPDGSIC